MQELDMDTLLLFDAHRFCVVHRHPQFVIYFISISRDSWRSVK